ncbi:hypothetical protein [Brevibacterium sp. UMB1308A]|uniref:hypothetical protein n=1 Tax=Brevibacterium sp. UMB1308A TaxID=3050608 RepID=UPI003306FE8E
MLAGRHPRRDELERYAGLNPTKDTQPQGGCCGPQQEAPRHVHWLLLTPTRTSRRL